jgi:psp operon transcriptional activator
LKWTPAFSPSATAELERYDWPGNVRELKNAVERAVYLSETPEITAITLDPLSPTFELNQAVNGAPALEKDRMERATPAEKFPLDFDALIADREIELLRGALQASHYHQQNAAKLLGLSYDRFRGLYRKYKSVWCG